MMQNYFPNACTILSGELKAARWHNLTDPEKIFDVLDSCMDSTYKQVRSACWGDKVRTMACDVLFREAQVSIDLARSSLDAMTVTVSPAPQASVREKKTDWVQPILLLLGAVLVLLGSVGFNMIRTLLGVLAAMCILSALMREMQKLMQNGAGMKLVRMAAKLLKKEKLLQWAEKLFPAHDPKPQTNQTALSIELDAAELEAACLQQMNVIDSNLALFFNPVQQKDDGGNLLPLARTILQEKYASPDALPESIEMEVEQYLRANDLRAIEYDPQHAAMFQTQPMDETFTIFPAIVDGNGCLIEYGVAGVQEE